MLSGVPPLADGELWPQQEIPPTAVAGAGDLPSAKCSNG